MELRYCARWVCRGQHAKHMESKLIEMGRVIHIYKGLDFVIQLFQNSKHNLKST